MAKVWPWLVMKDSVTYSALPDSFQTYLKWIVHKAPSSSPTGKALSAPRKPPNKGLVTMDASVQILPGVGPQSTNTFEAAGIRTVSHLIAEFERLGCERRRMLDFLCQTLPGAHRISLNILLKWLTLHTTEEKRVEVRSPGVQNSDGTLSSDMDKGTDIQLGD